MSDKPPEEPSSTPEIPDDVWEQFARDTERDIRASAPKEPSARAREVTERLKKAESKGKGKGKGKGKAERQEPEGWRTGPAWQEMNGRSRRRRRAWAVLGVPLAIAVAVVAMKPSLIPGDPFGGKAGSDHGAATPLAPETAAPTTAPSAVDPETPTLDRPFAGSPALNWADGAGGIVLPKATAVGKFSKDQVELALQQTKILLVGANLDPKTIRGDRPAAALAVLDPKQTKTFDRLNASLTAPTKAQDPTLLFSRFDPKDVRLVGDVVKTRGRITFGKSDDGGVTVHTDYTFVYPLVRTDGSTTVARTIVRRVIDLEILDPTRYQATPGLLALGRNNADFGNSACGVYDGYLHPEFGSASPTGAAPTGPTEDPYDRSRDLSKGKGTCGTATRT
ncbi:hypothetical protein [Streptomyces sp. NPDC101455]|uniref:hypothetical protein n=1 Tax=Streptomyces sp. NPDC101455 TaxID=3366142 RepID=UPI0037F10F73